MQALRSLTLLERCSNPRSVTPICKTFETPFYCYAKIFLGGVSSGGAAAFLIKQCQKIALNAPLASQYIHALKVAALFAVILGGVAAALSGFKNLRELNAARAHAVKLEASPDIAPDRASAEAYLKGPTIAAYGYVEYFEGDEIKKLYRTPRHKFDEDLVSLEPSSDDIEYVFMDQNWCITIGYLDTKPERVDYLHELDLIEGKKMSYYLPYQEALRILCVERPPAYYWLQALRNGEVVYMYANEVASLDTPGVKKLEIQCVRNKEAVPKFGGQNAEYVPKTDKEHPLPITAMGALYNTDLAKELALKLYRDKPSRGYIRSYTFDGDKMIKTHHCVVPGERREPCVIAYDQPPEGYEEYVWRGDDLKFIIASQPYTVYPPPPLS